MVIVLNSNPFNSHYLEFDVVFSTPMRHSSLDGHIHNLEATGTLNNATHQISCPFLIGEEKPPFLSIAFTFLREEKRRFVFSIIRNEAMEILQLNGSFENDLRNIF